MKYSHFLITRFNLKNNLWEIKNPDNNWLDQRFALFWKYCFPSIINQSTKNFKWLIYFNNETKNDNLTKLINLAQRYSFIEILFCANYDEFKTKRVEDVYKLYDNKEYVITTRIDNDDALHKNAIKCIQENFKPENDLALNMLYGLCYNEKGNILAKQNYNSNPFISLIESKDNIRTVYSKAHDDYIYQTRVLQIGLKPLWLQVIHGNNVTNSFKGNVTLNFLSLLNYGINPLKHTTIFTNGLRHKINRFLKRTYER